MLETSILIHPNGRSLNGVQKHNLWFENDVNDGKPSEEMNTWTFENYVLNHILSPWDWSNNDTDLFSSFYFEVMFVMLCNGCVPVFAYSLLNIRSLLVSKSIVPRKTMSWTLSSNIRMTKNFDWYSTTSIGWTMIGKTKSIEVNYWDMNCVFQYIYRQNFCFFTMYSVDFQE